MKRSPIDANDDPCVWKNVIGAFEESNILISACRLAFCSDYQNRPHSLLKMALECSNDCFACVPNSATFAIFLH